MTNKTLRFGTRTLDVLAILVLILSSLFLLLDTLIYKGQPANMDGVVHITNAAIFHAALADGDFPVRWTDGFANYGLPMGSFAQQFTSYAGGFLTFLTHDVVASFNIVYVVGTVLSVVLLYIFLRFYFETWPSFVGAFLFNFAPYRIINLYIRGALPEYFSSVFLVAILICLYLLFKKKSRWAFVGLALSTFGMILSHPMNVITSSIFIGPYFLFLLLQEKKKTQLLLLTLAAGLLGVLLSSYYLIPLLRDIRFLYYGSGGNHYNGSHLGIANFLDPNWYYYLVDRNEILSRGHFIKTGLMETIIFGIGLVVSIFRRVKKIRFSFFDLSLLVGVISLFLTLNISAILYEKINFLSNIQFPWRMLSTFIFIPPILMAALLNTTPWKRLSVILGFSLVMLVAWTRFPQVYGKNFTRFPQDHYYFTIDNLHTSNMNTIWTARTTEYEIKRDAKVGIIDGEAKIENLEIKNSHRTYTLVSDKETRMIDYTFYFPGWNVYVDQVEVPIEFQDVEHRGVITYRVPAGTHQVAVIFESTKIVLLGNMLTIVAVLATILVLFSPKLTKRFLS